MKLRHIPLKGLTKYQHASKLQDVVVRQFLAAKADSKHSSTNSAQWKSIKFGTNTCDRVVPPPTVITAQFHPVYTTGRRDYGTLTEEDKAVLRDGPKAEVFEALRGGQTTYHGPGQLTSYPIIDLRSHNLDTRSYICLLQQSLIAVCAHYGIRAMTTENTGVWVSEERKIAAVGVHLRRFVSSHGIGLNVSKEVDWGFGRIVACGLEGKKSTSLEAEGAVRLTVEDVGKIFVQELGLRLSKVDGVEAAMESEVSNLTERDNMTW